MRQQGLPGVKLGKAILFDPEDVHLFIKARKEVLCLVQPGDPTSNGTRIGGAGTSSTGRMAEPGNAARALLTAKKLIGSSHNSLSTTEGEADLSVRVIHHNFRSPPH
jgi:hypothetical protein